MQVRGGRRQPLRAHSSDSSQHAGDAHFLFADGHVQLISTSINLTVFKALSTRAGREVVGEF
jgi:prepilin-type processing-associated H-X9-DG protein